LTIAIHRAQIALFGDPTHMILGQGAYPDSKKSLSQEFIGCGFGDQAAQALKNIVAVLAEAGSRPEHLVRLTWYIADKQDYLASRKKLGDHYRQIIGGHFPAMLVLEVKGFIEDGARLEIEATAIVPDQAGVPLALGVGELQAKRWLSGCCR
jgi:enamine deaminase RidA (YjgF/YER057c/UK114 family)